MSAIIMWQIFFEKQVQEARESYEYNVENYPSQLIEMPQNCQQWFDLYGVFVGNTEDTMLVDQESVLLPYLTKVTDLKTTLETPHCLINSWDGQPLFLVARDLVEMCTREYNEDWKITRQIHENCISSNATDE
jgi:hypothetical protein